MEVIAHRGFAASGVENALPTLVAAEARADAGQTIGRDITPKTPNSRFVTNDFVIVTVKALFRP